MIATTKDNSEELLPLVDEEGHITGAATRGECHDGSKRLHPVVHLHVFNTRGDLYLQRRPLWKDIQPGRWDTAVGGHIDLGECVREAILREAQEELGLTLSYDVLTPLPPYVFESDRERELIYTFLLTHDGPLHPSQETDGGRWWTRQELAEAKGKGLLTPCLEQETERLFNHKL